MSDMISTLAVLEEQATERLLRAANNTVYAAAKDLARAHGLAEPDAIKLAAKIAARVARELREV